MKINSIFSKVYVSSFDHYNDTNPKDFLLYDLLVSTKYKELILSLRKERDATKQRAMKEQLPGFTPSARMKKGQNRSAAAMYRHSGFICVDIDWKDNQNVPDFGQLKQRMKRRPFVAACINSCRGQGYSVYIAIEYPEKHKLHFKWLDQYFKNIGITIDAGKCNPSDYRFVTYDEEQYINHDAERLAEYHTPPPATLQNWEPVSDADEIRTNVDYCIAEIVRLQLDVKDNADYRVTKVLVDKTKKKNATGVLKKQYITVSKAKWQRDTAVETSPHYF